MKDPSLLGFGLFLVVSLIVVIFEIRLPIEKRRIYLDSHTKTLPKANRFHLVLFALLLGLGATYFILKAFRPDLDLSVMKYPSITIMVVLMIAGLFGTPYQRK